MSNSSSKRKFDFHVESEFIPNRSEVLNRKLSLRPDRHQLICQGILPDSQCAPSLQHAEQLLKRARLADQLNHCLLNRPGPLDLIQEKILHIDTNEYSNLEKAIQGGQISFKTTRPSTSYRRPLIFHEYTGSPSLCKPKVTKIDFPSCSSSSSTSNVHEIRLAQQQLLLELTCNQTNVDCSRSISIRSLEQMTLGELRDQCKQHQIASSHANKNELIQRIEQFQRRIVNEDLSKSLSNKSNSTDDEIQLLSPSELDEILQTFPSNLTNEQEKVDNCSVDLDLLSSLIDPSTINSNDDDLFVQMLLDNDNSSRSEMMFDDYLLSNVNCSSPLPRITSVDEFDAFLRDFTNHLSSYHQQISTSTS